MYENPLTKSKAKFFFCEYVSSAYARSSEVEKYLLRKAREIYMNHVLSRREVENSVPELDKLQTTLMACYPSRRYNRIGIRMEETDTMVIVFLGPTGGSFIKFIPIVGSEKDGRASEIFNDGWWNCLKTVSEFINIDKDRIITETLTAACISSTEAFLRAATMLDEELRSIVREYGDILFESRSHEDCTGD